MSNTNTTHPHAQVCMVPNNAEGLKCIEVLRTAIKAYPEGGRKLRVRNRRPDRARMSDTD
jgi:hypothetical protein